MTTIKCAICGAEFEAPDKRYRLYCSRKCAKRAEHLRSHEKLIAANEEKKAREAKKGVGLNTALRQAASANISYGQYMAQKYIAELSESPTHENICIP